MTVKRAWIGKEESKGAKEGDPEMEAYLRKYSIPSYSQLTQLLLGNKNQVNVRYSYFLMLVINTFVDRVWIICTR